MKSSANDSFIKNANWHLKNLQIQDGRQNIEILLYVIKMARIDF